MANKKLQQESKYEKYDLDGDGIVTDAEFEMDQKLIRLENEDKKRRCTKEYDMVCISRFAAVSYHDYYM